MNVPDLKSLLIWYFSNGRLSAKYSTDQPYDECKYQNYYDYACPDTCFKYTLYQFTTHQCCREEGNDCQREISFCCHRFFDLLLINKKHRQWFLTFLFPVDFEQFYFKDQCAVWRDVFSGTTFSVSQVIWNKKLIL